MAYDADVIVIGSGGGGAVVAKELGELGLKVTVLEAGGWYGNKQWPHPGLDRGGKSSSRFEDLDIGLYRKTMNELEYNMNDILFGRMRWGPVDRRRSPWYRNLGQNGYLWQNSGVGGTTMHYWGNSPRAYPAAIDGQWPLSYRDLVPYYEKVEATLPVQFAAVTPKEELFYYAAKKAGWELIPTLDVTTPGYRPQPAAILPPNEQLMNPSYSLEQLSRMEGCTLRGHCVNGCDTGPSVDRIAKRSTNVSYIPLALKTGNVTVIPNAFATRIMTDQDPAGGVRATGVQYRNVWSGELEELRSRAVVMAAGCVETPRLWLNSDLPDNPWVGRGLTNHYFDLVSGIFEEKDLMAILGTEDVRPFVGNTSAARFDHPGLGLFQPFGVSPGLMAGLTYGTSGAGFAAMNEIQAGSPWDHRGLVVGPELKIRMDQYSRTLNLLIITDDEVDYRNGVSVDPLRRDEHGPVPVIRYTPTPKTVERRNRLAVLAANLLRAAGAKSIHRSDLPPELFIHLESTMRMGLVTDPYCEALQVNRLFIADNSVHYNSIGGPNPTLTTQALATRTAERLAMKYFP
ncbi:GMC family oxidoreductase N-terminal domain-containing protein [Gorillibacterium sp. sgz5001074]|uniref:GMC family oxidoreductase N-terminal domain-containing protein n=1 Tax=Gorillibacterium sp. sgz5001074 TaxID=3446695 RepID=UPI003F676FE3